MKSGRNFLIITNNPLVSEILGQHYQIHPMLGTGAREVLVFARDRVHLGHSLFTHPLSGSIKPNETPFKSLVISKEPEILQLDHAETMANAIAVWDKFTPRAGQYDDKAIQDFQLIDYTLLAGALEFAPIPALQQRAKGNH